MKHLIISREYPPAPGGGIGTYVYNISRMLAEAGETVHVIGQKWEGAEMDIEELMSGKLIIHRIPLHDWTTKSGYKIHPDLLNSNISVGLYESGYFPQCFSYNASLLSEKLIIQEGIDIIEAQEFDAPLYYFQVRRSLGLGPKTYPPNVIHLHTPTEFTTLYNDWDIYDPYYMYAMRFESYSIKAADALISPSNYLANRVKDYYRIDVNNLRIIPYPLGRDIKFIKRHKSIWENGRIIYLGRLEKRKGVIEYVDAAVNICREFPGIQFDFIGGDVIEPDSTSVKKLLLSRIPDNVKSSFRFHGHKSRAEIGAFLAESKISVIPSRFENFPHTCIESMGSGLPIITSPYGGMAEMVENDISGWISDDLSIENLSKTIKKALRTSPDVIENMGLNASQRIFSLCDNNTIVNSQLEYKSNILRNKNNFFLSIPLNVSWRYKDTGGSENYISYGARTGIAIILIGFYYSSKILETLHNINKQSKKPTKIIILTYDELIKNEVIRNLKNDRDCDLYFLDTLSCNFRKTLQNLINLLKKIQPTPIGISLIEENINFDVDYIKLAESVLVKNKIVGIVSAWTEVYNENFKLVLNPCASMPYQLFLNEIMPFSIIRTEALMDYELTISEKEYDMSLWELFNIILTGGWVAVTIPLILNTINGQYAEYSQLNRSYSNRHLKNFISALGDNNKIEFVFEFAYFISSFKRLNQMIKELEFGKNWLEKLSNDRQEWIEVLTRENELLRRVNKYNPIYIYHKIYRALKRLFSRT